MPHSLHLGSQRGHTRVGLGCRLCGMTPDPKLFTMNREAFCRLCGMADYGDGLLHGECVAIGSNPYTPHPRP